MMKSRIFSLLCVATYALVNSPVLLAAEEEEAQSDPVWVLSYASFLIFAAITVFLCVFFSRRRETILGMEDQKRVGQIRNDRIKQRRKEQQYAKIHAQKKK